MSQRTWNIDHGPMRGFYRDRESGWVFGVCAGLSDRFNLNLGAIRIIAVVSLCLFFWLTAAIYLAATVLIREKPLVYSGRESEFEFWHRRNGNYWRRS